MSNRWGLRRKDDPKTRGNRTGFVCSSSRVHAACPRVTRPAALRLGGKARKPFSPFERALPSSTLKRADGRHVPRSSAQSAGLTTLRESRLKPALIGDLRSAHFAMPSVIQSAPTRDSGRNQSRVRGVIKFLSVGFLSNYKQHECPTDFSVCRSNQR